MMYRIFSQGTFYVTIYEINAIIYYLPNPLNNK